MTEASAGASIFALSFLPVGGKRRKFHREMKIKIAEKVGPLCRRCLARRTDLAACWCVRRSLDDLTRCEVLVRIIARYPVVYREVVGVIQSAEASESESVSHNASEPSSAPLRSGSGQPANNGEASTGREATSVCSDRAPRGVRG